MKAIVLIISFFVALPVFAQRSHLEQGDEYFRKRFYKEAIQEYELALQEKVVVKKFYMTERVAKTYKMLFDYENAVLWYGKLMEFKEENSPENIIDYARLLMNVERYDDAITVFESNKEKFGFISDFNQWCNWAKKNKNEFAKYAVYVTGIETGSRSMGIAFFKEGLVYAKPQIQEFNTKTAFYDLAYLPFIDSIKFNEAQILQGDLNRSFYEGTPAFSPDQNTLYYSGNSSTITKYRGKNNSKTKVSKDGINILKIFSASWNGNAWTTITELPFNSNEYDCVFPNLSSDGSTLYFASNMPGGLGGFDIYKVQKDQNGAWSKIENLGPEVNSPLDEMYPFSKGDSLFFSSKGKPGFGGADIFVVQLVNGKAQNCSNIGQPFNSSKDDFSIIARDLNGRLEGYFSSNREGSHGYDKIYFFREFPKPVYPDTIQGIAINKITLQPLKDVKISLIKKLPGQSPEKVNAFVTDKTGKVELIMDKKVAYEVTFEAQGFQTKTVQVPETDREDVIAKFGDLQMEPEVKKNTIIKIPNIYFDYDKATLRPESFKVLAQIIQFLNDNPTVRVEMSAHTDSRGSDAYNMKLSQKRAESTVKYLIEHGIAAGRLVPKGYGETKVLNQCKNGVKCSEEEHEFNRRVEMKVL